MSHFHITFSRDTDDGYDDTLTSTHEVMHAVSAELTALADDAYAMIGAHGDCRRYEAAYHAFTRYGSYDVVARNAAVLANQLALPVVYRAPVYHDPETTDARLDTAVRYVLARAADIAPIVVTRCDEAQCAPEIEV